MRPAARLLVLSTFALSSLTACAGTGVRLPDPKVDETVSSAHRQETAVFAGGCFWGTQSVFERVKGVIRTTAGYSGGVASTATYGQVSWESVIP